MGWAYDETKLIEMVLYFAEGLRGEQHAGSTKLNKLLWFADTAHVRTHGEPISGAEYQRLPRGPAPRRLLPIRSGLIARGEAEVKPEATALGKVQHRLVPTRLANRQVFTAEELSTLEAVLEEYRTATGWDLSEASHEEPGWVHAATGDSIPLATALLDPVPEVTEEMRSRARALVDQHAR